MQAVVKARTLRVMMRVLLARKEDSNGGNGTAAVKVTLLIALLECPVSVCVVVFHLHRPMRNMQGVV